MQTVQQLTDAFIADIHDLVRRVALDAVRGALGQPTTGAVLYVDSFTGDDATAVRGDASRPFRTPEAAYEAMRTGDTVHFAPGRYLARETLRAKVLARVQSFGTQGAGLRDLKDLSSRSYVKQMLVLMRKAGQLKMQGSTRSARYFARTR